MNDDLIRRQAAIDAICEECHMETDYHRCEGYKKDSRWCEYSTALNDLPSAQPEQRWIPCSERLPEEFYVLCCDNYGEMLIANPFECDDSDTGFSAESEDCYMYNCVAWMPLPEPYKREES